MEQNREYECRCYSDKSNEYPLVDVPEHFWRKMELTYADEGQVVLVYDQEPADPDELPALMWQLQSSAGRYGFAIKVVGPDGAAVEAPPISPKHATEESNPA